MMGEHFRILEVSPGLAGVEAAITAIHELFEDDISVALIAPEADRSALHVEQPVRCGEPALILLTSGSTGQPRAVEIPLSALAESAAASAVHFHNQAVWFTALPVTSMGGINTVIRSALAGTAPVIWDGVAGAAPFVAAELAPYIDATVTSARKQKLAAAASFVPTQMHRMLNDAEAVSALKNLDYILVGGGAMNQKDIDFAQELGIRLVRTYGATETSGGCVYDGVPLEGVEITVDESGFIALHGAMLAHSYRDGELIHESGWRSSDIGSIEHGRLVVKGRADDVIKSAGYLLNVQKLAQTARMVPGVEDAQSASAPSDEYGSLAVIAYSGSADVAAVETHVRESIQGIKVPLRIVNLPSIPLLPNGKPDRTAISQL
jgi:O-succinylbenzoic acid--CoA ligase